MSPVRRRTAILTTFLLVLALAVWWQFLRRQAPSGQPPLVYLDGTSVEEFKRQFNADANAARAIVLLSPT